MKRLYYQLLPYLNKTYCHGHIRWLLMTRPNDKAKPRSVSCVFCGNIANVIGVIHFMKSKFNLPICKSHMGEWLEKNKPEVKSFTAPCFIRMHVKYIEHQPKIVLEGKYNQNPKALLL